IKEAFNQKKPTIFGFNEDDLINAILQILNKPEVQEVI
ncbi:MAG: lipoate--protein ligase family protein, partial [Saccharolobus sp.]